MYGMTYIPQYQNGAMHDVLTQYKGQYQQPMQVPMGSVGMQMPQMQPSAPANDMIWVQGEAGAKSFLVAPNATVVLWDTESPTIYIKSADGSGKPLEMKILDFKERGTPQKEHKCTCGENFVDKDTFRQLQEKYTQLEGIVNKLVAEKEETNA